MELDQPPTQPQEMLFNLVQATNAHDLDALVGCFSPDYRNETPVHPARSFQGSEQVRTNWQQILSGVPDIHIEVSSFAVRENRVWCEMEMKGTRRDGAAHLMRGVVIFDVSGGQAVAAHFYMEPVQAGGGDVNEAVREAMANRPEVPR